MADDLNPKFKFIGVHSPEELARTIKGIFAGEYDGEKGQQYEVPDYAALVRKAEQFKRENPDTPTKVSDGILDSIRGQGGYSAPNTTVTKSPIGPSWTLPEQYAQFGNASADNCDGVLSRAQKFYDKKDGKWILKAEPYQLREGETPGDIAAIVPRVGDITYCERRR